MAGLQIKIGSESYCELDWKNVFEKKKKKKKKKKKGRRQQRKEKQ